MIVRKMKADDYKEAATLHKVSYEKDHFTSRFSIPMLSNFYKEIALLNSYCYVAVDENEKIVGVALAGENTKKSVYRFIFSNKMRLILTLLKNPSFTITKIKDFISTFFKKSEFQSKAKIRFLNLLVDPRLHGKGVGKLLTERFEYDLKNDGYELYGHSVKNNNIKTIKFHMKNNCVIEYESKGHVYFLKYLL